MTQPQANSLSSKDYNYQNMKLLDYTQTADGNTLWKFVWADNRRNNALEIHYHKEPDNSTGCNVRWYQVPRDRDSVNPAPQWIIMAALWAAASLQNNYPPGNIF